MCQVQKTIVFTVATMVITQTFDETAKVLVERSPEGNAIDRSYSYPFNLNYPVCVIPLLSCCNFAFARAESREQEHRAQNKNAIFCVTMLYFLKSIYLFVTISMYFTGVFLNFSYIIKQRK